MKTKIFLFLALIITVSCSKDSQNEKAVPNVLMDMDVASYEAPSPPPPPSSSLPEFNKQPKLIKTGEIKIKSKEIENSKNKLKEILFQCKGNVKYESLSKYEDESYYNLLFDVPVSKFETFIYKLDSLQLDITEKTFRVTDVTLRYVDETSRLRNKKKLELTYLDLLSKAKSITSIIEIQSKIEEIRADIESKEEQIKSLDNQIAFSEFSIKVETPQLKKKKDTEYKPDNFEKFTEAFYVGITGIIDTLVFLLSIWPIYIIISILYFIFRIYQRRKKQQVKITE